MSTFFPDRRFTVPTLPELGSWAEAATSLNPACQRMAQIGLGLAFFGVEEHLPRVLSDTTVLSKPFSVAGQDPLPWGKEPKLEEGIIGDEQRVYVNAGLALVAGATAASAVLSGSHTDPRADKIDIHLSSGKVDLAQLTFDKGETTPVLMGVVFQTRLDPTRLIQAGARVTSTTDGSVESTAQVRFGGVSLSGNNKIMDLDVTGFHPVDAFLAAARSINASH